MLNNPYNQLKFPSDSSISAKSDDDTFIDIEMNHQMEQFLSKKQISKQQQETNKKEQRCSSELQSEKDATVYAPIHMFNRLRQYPLKTENLEAEEKYYNKQYSLNKSIHELGICVISANDYVQD